ncbi:alpha/beta fold hydrolase [Lacisediminihabitans profunda]|uniref:Alpha/beta hydrolase n=1 Tax=Lacisediminihabitans profunda TaxID=2594790 RepID=A0A5C8UKQ6_9MICO|nr:alpha/beta hydrolase [Lacisediminihabitans profunda]TXN28364.1 alpha/beta hydrolase [Lacisediminihabitans profunda]
MVVFDGVVFEHHMTDVGGVRLHSVIGGVGQPVFLLHGFPQTWREWRHVMGPLAQHHTVIAVDLKGSGDSDKPVDGYSKLAMARELDTLRRELGYGEVSVVGHDIGGMTAFAWAASAPASVQRVAIIDVPIPGASFWDTALVDPKLWHFAFHQHRNLPEQLIQGREFLYIDSFVRERIYNQGGITTEDVAVFAEAMARPGAIRGMLEWYRAFPRDADDNREFARTPLELPVLAIGGDQRWGSRMVGILQEFAVNVTGGSIANCGHWVPEERPQELLDLLVPFLNGGSDTSRGLPLSPGFAGAGPSV